MQNGYMEDGEEKEEDGFLGAGFGEIGCRNGEWKKLGKNCVQWRTLVLTALNLLDLQK